MYRVELKAQHRHGRSEFQKVFLMYRVELKDIFKEKALARYSMVPNVPCGVERHIDAKCVGKKHQFLMYRVELKVDKRTASSTPNVRS